MNGIEIPPQVRGLIQNALNAWEKARRVADDVNGNEIPPRVRVLFQNTLNVWEKDRRVVGDMNGNEIPPQVRGLCQNALNVWEKARRTGEAAHEDLAPTEMVAIEPERESDGDFISANLAETLRATQDVRRSEQTSDTNKPASKRSTEKDEAPAPTDTVEAHKTVMVHSPEFSTVKWGEKTLTFTVRQAACVCVMWEQFQNETPFLSPGYILANASDKYCEKTGLDVKELKGLKDCPRLRDVYKNHEAWGTMIKKRGRNLFGLVAPPR